MFMQVVFQTDLGIRKVEREYDANERVWALNYYEFLSDNDNSSISNPNDWELVESQEASDQTVHYLCSSLVEELEGSYQDYQAVLWQMID